MSFLVLREPPAYGARPYDNIYVAPSNSLKSISRTVVQQADKLSLSVKNFGRSVTTINLPEARLLGHTTLNMIVPASAIPDKSFLLQNWVYKAVEYYEYTFANSERLRIDVSSGQLLLKNMADCETGDKRDTMNAYAGEVKLRADEEPDIVDYEGSISLYLPFSNVSAARCHPFPGDILQRPVQITIGFNPFINVLSYAAEDAADVRAALTGEYREIYMMCKTSLLKDPADSIAEMVSIRGNEKYVYPYMYPQTFNFTTPFQGKAQSDAGAKCSVQLDRFLNGALQSIDVWLVRKTLKTQDLATWGMDLSPNQPYMFEPIINARLVYGGQTIWRSDGKYSAGLMNLSEYTTSTSFNVLVPNYTKATIAGALGAKPKRSQWLHIPLALLNETYFSNLAQNGVSLYSNQVLLEFNTQEPGEVDMLDSAETITGYGELPMYSLGACLNYSAAVRTAKSETNLVFQSELEALPAVSGLIGTF